jgi:peptidoglycan-associated lipoprotein
MKLTKLHNLLFAGLVLAVAVTGCRHHTPTTTPLPKGGMAGESGGPGAGGKLSGEAGTGGELTGIASNPAGSHEGWIPHPDVFQSDTVYFAYDSSVVKPGETAKVAAVADYLKGNSSEALKIEGYCDERGTEEYNRALGERRALALREALAGLGIDPTRVDTISYGKDRPAVPGHNEAAWKMNRRGVFILLTPPK